MVHSAASRVSNQIASDPCLPIGLSLGLSQGDLVNAEAV